MSENMSETNKTLIREFYDDLNRGDLDAVMGRLADDFVEHEALPGVPPTKEGVGVFFGMLREAFSGLRMNVDALAADGDVVVARVTMTGTHTGEFMGVPPSNKEIQVPICDWIRVRDGKAIEHWGVTDMSGLMG